MEAGLLSAAYGSIFSVSTKINKMNLMVRGRLKMNKGCSPACGPSIQVEPGDQRMVLEQGMDCPAEHTFAFAVNDPYIMNPFFKTCPEIFIHH